MGINDLASELLGLNLGTPRDYFHGISAQNLCLADNFILFLRRKRGELQQRNFETRPHHRWVLVICFGTEGSINVDGHAFHLRPGDAFLVKPYQFHFYLEIADEHLAWLFLTFETAYPIPFESFANTPITLDRSHLEQALQIASQFNQISSAGEVAIDSLSFAATSLLNQIRMHRMGQTRDLIARPAYPSTGYELVGRIIRLLEQNLSENINILNIAEALSLSESHLRKRFKRLTGLSLGSYLLHYKLNRAVKLLAHSEQSLTQISVECGYESLAAFSRSFKKNLGVSPFTYRKTASFGDAQ